jgi:large subunit ribosomal protein L15
MKIHELTPAPGSHRPRKRVGRGISSGQGKTSGRGQKGQGSRSSVNIPRSFEGGQMPLAQRVPKLRGFSNINRREFAEVNIGKLNRFDAGTEVNPQLLQDVGLVRKALDGVKILAAGELKVALKVSAHRVSSGARKAIEAAGGSVELLGPQTADKPEKRRKTKHLKALAEKAAAAAAPAPRTDSKKAAKSDTDAGSPGQPDPAGAGATAPAPATAQAETVAAAPEASAPQADTAESAEDHEESGPSDAPEGE